MCVEYHIQVNIYYVSAQGVDEGMINVHYYYGILTDTLKKEGKQKEKTVESKIIIKVL